MYLSIVSPNFGSRISLLPHVHIIYLAMIVSATDYNYLFKKVFGMAMTQSRQAI
jgi:hypothetical protein